ncbi:hypothetical protein, partial [Metamycoplasma equirhinis]
QTMLITRIIYSNDSFGDVYSLRQLVRDASKKKPNGAPTGIVKLQDLVNNLFLNKYSRFPNDYTKVWQNAWNNRDEIQNDYKMVIDEYKQIRDYSGTGRWGSDETFEKSIHKFFNEDVYYPIK